MNTTRSSLVCASHFLISRRLDSVGYGSAPHTDIQSFTPNKCCRHLSCIHSYSNTPVYSHDSIITVALIPSAEVEMSNSLTIIIIACSKATELPEGAHSFKDFLYPPLLRLRLPLGFSPLPSSLRSSSFLGYCLCTVFTLPTKCMPLLRCSTAPRTEPNQASP